MASQELPACGARLHPAWSAFIRYCQQIRFGDIEKLRIQDGIPTMAELTTQKVRFGATK